MKRIKAVSCIIMAAVLWGSVGIFFKELSAFGFSPMQIVAIRVTVSACVMAAYLVLTNKTLLRVKIKDCGLFVGTGIMSLLFFNWCYFCAIEESSMSVAAVLLYTAPAFVMVLSALLFNEKFNLRKLVVIIITILGCVFVTGFLESNLPAVSIKGILFGIGSGIGYALYSIFGKIALRKYNPATISFYTFFFASAAAIPLAGFNKGAVALFNFPSILFSLGIGVLCCMLPFFLYTKGLEEIDAGPASILATIEPAVAMAFGAALYGEILSPGKMMGVLMIFLSIVLINFKLRQPVKEDKIC